MALLCAGFAGKAQALAHPLALARQHQGPLQGTQLQAGGGRALGCARQVDAVTAHGFDGAQARRHVVQVQFQLALHLHATLRPKQLH